MYRSHTPVAMRLLKAFIALFMLTNTGIARAQSVHWTSGYPSLDQDRIVTLEDERTLRIRVAALGSDIDDASIVVTLPASVEYVAGSAQAIFPAGTTISPTVSGSTVTLKITSHGNKLQLNQETEFHLKVKAGTCVTPAVVTFGVEVKSNGNAVTDGSKTISANIVQPLLTLTPQNAVVNFTSQTETKTITYYLKATTVDKASSARVSFTTPDAATTLSDFKVKGTNVTPTETPAGSGKKYTFDVTPALLSNAKIDDTDNTLITFTGASTDIGAHIVTTDVQFPEGTTSCTSNSGYPVQLVFPVPSQSHIVHVKTDYVSPYPTDAVIANDSIHMDGSMETHVKTVFRNTGGLTKEIKFEFKNYGEYGYMNKDQIYVQVGNNGTRRLLTNAEIHVRGKIVNSAEVQQRYGIRKSDAVGKPRHIDVTIKDPIPAGETITFWIPTVNGKIYQNARNNVYNNYWSNTINGITSNVLYVTAADGTPGTMETQPSVRIKYYNVPHYREVPASLNLKAGATKTQTVYVAPGSTHVTEIELGVKAPSWVTITDMKITPRIDPNDIPAGWAIPSTPIVHAANHKSLKIGNKGNLGEAYLHVTYQIGTCVTPGVNTTDTIQYYGNQKWKDGTLMDYATQVFQPITQLCKKDGITLDTFQLVRMTKGLKDTNNNRVADSNTPAPDNEIDHNLYMEKDNGYFYWKGTVQASGNNATHIDMPLKLAAGLKFFNGNSGILQMQTPTGIVKRGATQMTGGTASFTRVADQRGFVRFHFSSGLHTDDTVEIKAPFTLPAGKGANEKSGVETEMYVNKLGSGGILPSGDGNRLGEEKASLTMGTYTFDVLNWWYQDIHKHSFGDNSEVSFMGEQNLGYTDIIHKGNLGSPYFKNEVRVLWYLDRLEFEMPKGYRLAPQIELREEYGINTAHPTLQPDGSSTKTRRIYNVKSVYDFSYYEGGTLAPGKWTQPDDRWLIRAYGKIQAYPSAPRIATKMRRTSVWKNINGDSIVHTRDIEFTYTGPGNTLSGTPKIAEAKGLRMTSPTLQIANQSDTAAIQNLYFYFEGPIKDVKLKEGNNIYNGEGVDNRWVKVNPTIAGGTSVAYQMMYTYAFDSTRTDCSKKDTVYVYTGFSPNANWPNTAQPLTEDSSNFSARDTFYIVIDPTAHILGDITAKKDTFPAADQHIHHLDSTYTVYATFEASTTKGAVKNPEMQFTVPAHQRYKPGTAKLRHSGRVIPVPASSPLELRLVAEFGSTSDIPRSARLKLKEAYGADLIIPGGNETPASLRKDSLEMVFMADCETDFTGINYKGEVYGSAACGAAADGSGASFTKRLIPNVTYNYRFGKVGIAMKGMPAFNEFRTRDTLELTIEKIVGTQEPMSPTDYLLVRVPKQMNVDGDSVHYKGLTTPMATLDLRDSIISRDSIGPDGERYIKIPLPKTAYDNATDKGVHGKIRCSIPVVYTPGDAARISHPVDSIFASVTIQGLFGDCPPRTILDGLNKDSVAMITAKGPFPPRLYVGEEDTLEILSHGFHGKLYTDSTGAVPGLVGPKWAQTPRDTSQLGEEKYYFTPEVDEHYYGAPAGRLPFPVKIWIHPWFIKNLPRFKYICEEQDTLRVKGGGMDIHYQWFRDESPIVGATDTILVVRENGRYHVEITDTVPETVASDTCDVYFREFPVILKDLEDILDCENIYIPLAVKHTGRFMLYQWYRNGRPIPGANDSVYRASAYDSSGFYRVKVMNPCGDSVLSRRCCVDFCDAKWDGPARVVELFAPNTVKTDPNTRRNLVASRSDFQFTVHALSGQSLRYATITADHPAWTEGGGGIERTMISDSLMTVRVRQVNQNLQIHVAGISPTGNGVIDGTSSRRLWTHKGRLYFAVDRAQTVRLYTVMGHLYREQSLEAGQTVVDHLPAGLYLVRFPDGKAEKVHVE